MCKLNRQSDCHLASRTLNWKVTGRSHWPPEPPSAAPHSFEPSVPHFCLQSELVQKRQGQLTGMQEVSLWNGLPLAGTHVSPLWRCPNACGHSGELACGCSKRRMHFPNSSRHDPHLPYWNTHTHRIKYIYRQPLSPTVETVFRLTVPVIKLLGYVQVLQVIIYGSIILLQKCVGVS